MERSGRKGSPRQTRLHYTQLASCGHLANRYEKKTIDQHLKAACWYIMTLPDKANNSHLERRFSLMAYELSLLDIDLAALCGVRLADEGSHQYHGAGHQFFLSRKPSIIRCSLCVCFMVRISIASKLERSASCHSNSMIFTRLPLKCSQHLTHFSVYALTLLIDPMLKNSFYLDLHRHLSNNLANHEVPFLSDFTAMVGRNSVAWKGVLGRHAVGNGVNNGRLMLEFSTEYQLAITNAIFQLQDCLRQLGCFLRPIIGIFLTMCMYAKGT